MFEDIGRLSGRYVIQLREDAVSTAAAPHRVPSAIKDKVKTELDWMWQQGVITKVTEPTEWVHPIVIITKKYGNVKICLDPRNLNAAVKGQHYKMPVPEELLARLSNSAVFLVLDANSAFWQLKLDERSSYCAPSRHHGVGIIF